MRTVSGVTRTDQPRVPWYRPAQKRHVVTRLPSSNSHTHRAKERWTLRLAHAHAELSALNHAGDMRSTGRSSRVCDPASAGRCFILTAQEMAASQHVYRSTRPEPFALRGGAGHRRVFFVGVRS